MKQTVPSLLAPFSHLLAGRNNFSYFTCILFLLAVKGLNCHKNTHCRKNTHCVDYMFVAFCLLQECEEHSSCQTERISGEIYSSLVSFTFLETFQQQANTEINQSSPSPTAGFGRCVYVCVCVCVGGGGGGWRKEGVLVLLELGTRKLTSVIAFFSESYSCSLKECLELFTEPETLSQNDAW